LDELTDFFGSPKARRIVRWASDELFGQILSLGKSQTGWSARLHDAVLPFDPPLYKSTENAMDCAAVHAQAIRYLVNALSLFAPDGAKEAELGFGLLLRRIEGFHLLETDIWKKRVVLWKGPRHAHHHQVVRR
jgi:hypothetical protein